MTHEAVCPGVIGGIVSFCLLHAVEWVLDWGSSRTNGAFGTTTPAIAPDAHHGINPKDSAHEIPKPNGKPAVDEEVSLSLKQIATPPHTCDDMQTPWLGRLHSRMSSKVIRTDIP